MSSIDELSIIRLYRAYNTVIQMCMDRGFPVRHPSVVAQALRDPSLYTDAGGLDYDWFLRNFVAQEGAGLQRTPLRHAMRLVCGSGDSGRAVFVFFAAPALTAQELHACRSKALVKEARAMIIVSAGRIAPAVRREARELSGRLRPGTTEELLPVQLFEEDALAFNVARHETVPPHEPLSASDAQELLKSRELKISQLPRMLEADPMVAYWGLQRGSVVRVKRHTKETGTFDMYRQVI